MFEICCNRFCMVRVYATCLALIIFSVDLRRCYKSHNFFFSENNKSHKLVVQWLRKIGRSYSVSTTPSFPMPLFICYHCSDRFATTVIIFVVVNLCECMWSIKQRAKFQHGIRALIWSKSFGVYCDSIREISNNETLESISSKSWRTQVAVVIYLLQSSTMRTTTFGGSRVV